MRILRPRSITTTAALAGSCRPVLNMRASP
jgi:hypothetical protein